MASTKPSDKAGHGRRVFLQLAGSGALALIAGCQGRVMSAYSPWNDVMRRPDPNENPGRTMLAAGILAPSVRNTQPWKFKLLEDSILVYPDYTRQLLVTDPQARELTISLGCAIENIAIAANACGRLASVEYLTPSSKNDPLAAIYFGTELEQPPTQSDVYVPAIANRHTNRRRYSTQAIENDKLQMLADVGSSGAVHCLPLTEKAKIEMARISGDATLTLNKSEAYIKETIYWSRYSGEEIDRRRDGLAVVHPGVGWPESCFARFVMNTFDVSEQQAAREREFIEQSPTTMLILSEQDDFMSWLDTGRCYCRLALTATAMDIQNQPHTSSILLHNSRRELSELACENKYISQIPLRLGYSATDSHSPRRSLDDVIETGQE